MLTLRAVIAVAPPVLVQLEGLARGAARKRHDSKLAPPTAYRSDTGGVNLRNRSNALRLQGQNSPTAQVETSPPSARPAHLVGRIGRWLRHWRARRTAARRLAHDVGAQHPSAVAGVSVRAVAATTRSARWAELRGDIIRDGTTQAGTIGIVRHVPTHAVRKAQPTDVAVLGATLSLAFDDDPLTVWLFPDAEARRRKLPRFFRSLLRASLPSGEVFTADDARCAAIWNPPGTFPMGWQKDARLGLITTSLIGLRITTCARGLMYFASHHPKERHWYLQMLGTDPEWQGHGAGSAIMAPVLERCDREGERIYLESSKKRNIPFYERHGFVVTGEIQVPRGPVVWAMWRDPL